MKGWIAVAGGLVLVQALVLAAVAIPAPHDGGDHTAYLTLAYALTQGLGYIELWDPELPLHTKYPPGYPLILAVLMVFGATTWSAFKLSSAVAISAATLAAFAWAARRVGWLGAGGLALLLILASGWQDASRWILSEPWFLLWTFLAFWAADLALEPSPSTGAGTGGSGVDGAASARSPGAGEGASGGPGRTLWLVLAGFGALMAFGVRSAGLPVVLALLLVLLWNRRFRAAGVFAGVTALLVGGWLVITARGGEGAYQDEFWLADPYDPELGTVGLGGLLARIWENLVLYVGRVLPGEWWSGAPEWLLLVGGVTLTLLALWGWLSRLLRRPGLAEIFLPLYGGMILIWPQVWSGDRFLLPLLPLILLYAGTVVVELAREVALRWSTGGRRGPDGFRSGRRKKGRQVKQEPAPAGGAGRGVGLVVGAVGVLALAGPSIPTTLQQSEMAGNCRTQVALTGDAFSCYGPGFTEFRAAAAWMGANLPEDAVVLSRKPRILYALGGPRGRTFPFLRDGDAFLAEADRMNGRYLLVDRVDGIAGRYLPLVLSDRPRAFCYVGGWGGGPQQGGTDLVGILPPELREEGGGRGDIARCPEGWVRSPQEAVEAEGLRIPLLVQSSGGGRSP